MTERDAMTQLDALIVIIEFFSLKIEVKKNFFKIGKYNKLKMKNMTQRDALNTKNYILAHQEIDF